MVNTFAFEGVVTKCVPAFTRNGMQVTKITVAQHQTWQGKEKTELAEVTFFGDKAARYSAVKPGTHVIVFGRSSGRENEHNGKTYFNMTLMGSTIGFLHEDAPAPTAPAPYPHADATEEDVPF